MKSGKIDITEATELKLQLFAFGKDALIDTIYADSTADTITVYLRLDGYDAIGSNLRTGIGDCSSNPIETPYIPYIDPCLQDQIDLAINNAYAAYEQQIIELTESFKEAYIAQCMGNLSEDFTKSFSSSEYHYTLYYYDQAGNLTMTVPPAGVDILDATEMTAMESYRYGGGDEIVPNHTLETRYRYNSLNQLTMQSTPDAGESRFWYDALGRIVLSQNAKQAHVGESGVDQQEFSYTRYDELGRIYEVGELQIDDELITSTYIKAAVIDQASLTSALIAEGTVSEVTSTYYNQPFTLPGSPFGTSGQTNQRNRISAVTIEAEPDTDPDTYDHATHYSYDIHGNVHTLIQDNPSIGEIQAEERFKKVQYTYDLVSGNVMLVAYQDNMADQMYHAYQYDADNRIYEVQSSRDGYIWEKEARYFYYRHGPLARVETGDLIVQGTDYAYTIQGWLKGVNAGALIPDRDMGKDGYDDASNTHKYIAQDAFGFTLGYFDDDYTQINTGAAYKFLPNVSATNFDGAANSLFNGNIMSMSTALLRPLEAGDADGKHDKADVLGKVYSYDQLNRIKSSSSYEKAMTTTAAFTWGGASTYAVNKWKTSYTYDGNGNILTMNRAGTGASGYDMDQMTYHYYEGTNQLQYVGDAVADAAYTDIDIDDQAGIDSDPIATGTQHDIYTYDKIGNLVSDLSEGIESIAWTVYGKIKSIAKSDDTNLEFAYDATGNRIMKKFTPASGPIVYTYYVRDAQGNIMAVYTREEEGTSNTLDLSELHIYGSSRLGMVQTTVDMLASFTEDSYFYRTLGEKRYELTNHLGNVLSVISDRRLAFDTNADGVINIYEADVISAQDYDPFGMLLPGREWKEGYRFGFGGLEQDYEISSRGNYFTAEFWEYDAMLGRRWNLDPIRKTHESPYAAFSNSPLFLIDPTGADTLLYSKNTGTKLTTKINPEDKKNPIWIVDENAYNYDPSNPWLTATALVYQKGKNNPNKKIDGKNLRKNHPLKNIGWAAGSQVYEEDLLDMTDEFNEDVTDALFLFGTIGKSYKRLLKNKLNTPEDIMDTKVEMYAKFASLVGPNRRYDLKSTKRAGLNEDASYDAEFIGEYSLYNGNLMHYDDYGNYAFGVWGHVYGLTLSRISSAADIAQRIDKGNNDPARDQFMVKTGYNNFPFFREMWLMDNMGAAESLNN